MCGGGLKRTYKDFRFGTTCTVLCTGHLYIHHPLDRNRPVKMWGFPNEVSIPKRTCLYNYVVPVQVEDSVILPTQLAAGNRWVWSQ